MQTLPIEPNRAADPISPLAALLAGKKVGPDATELLAQEHRQVASWFRSYRVRTEEPVRLRLIEQICLHLEAHMQFEEEVFYAAARELLDEEGLLEHAEHEHAQARTIIAQLQAGPPAGEQRDQLVTNLEAAILLHVNEEEGVLFPKVRASGVDLYALGRSLAARRGEVMADLTGKPLPSIELGLD
jgi:hypothetical protein